MNTKQSNLKLVLAGLLLGILMASMDNTIVATAMGTIVGELGGLDKFVWVTSAYMVAEMAGMPIFGKLSDMFGRKKKFFIFGLIVFLFGSILCGTAQSIVQLSIYRAIQASAEGRLFRSHSRLCLTRFRWNSGVNWAVYSVRCSAYRVFSVRCWAPILPTISAGTGCFM